MTENAELPIFLDVQYEPDNEFVPGRLAFFCRFEDHGWSGRIIERGFVFQYFQEERQLFFYVFPTYVQLPLGKPSCLEEAIEQAKRFLRRWLGKDRKFQLEVSREIRRLEEEQEAAKRSGKASSQSQGD